MKNIKFIFLFNILVLFTVNTIVLAYEEEKKPLVILVSIDGFKYEYLHRGLTPTLNKLAKQGASSKGLISAFPSVTFPNHYSLVTGLTPDHHGIVNNRMYDPEIPYEIFHYSLPKNLKNPEWWEEATPIWVSAKQQGKKVSTLYWPGTETSIHGTQPDDWLPYNAKMTSLDRVEQLLTWLDRPDEQRADFATLYFSKVDSLGHKYGTNSAAVNNAIDEIDRSLAIFLQGLEKLDLKEVSSFVIVSDHGMADVAESNIINIKSLIRDYSDAAVLWTGAYGGIEAKPESVASILEALSSQKHLSCWQKENLPKRFKFGTHRRIPKIFCLAELGWFITDKDQLSPVLGMHGYDPALQDMHGLFIASGHRIKSKKQPLDYFDNVDVYPLLVELLNIKGLAHDGDNHLLELLE